MEIIIGRDVKNPMDIKVPESFSMVGKNHAKITIEDNLFTIEDLTSKNGTYVNKKSIRIKNINPNDNVILGDINNGYIVDIKKIINNYNDFKFKNKTDFSIEFDNLKPVFDEYLKKKNKIKKDAGRKNLNIRIYITLIGFFISGLLIFSGLSQFTFISVGLVGIIVTAMSFLKSDDTALKDQLDLLDIDYNELFNCPKCRKPLPLSKSWIIYKTKKKCPNNCGAIYG